jgi:hypothetical protein
MSRFDTLDPQLCAPISALLFQVFDLVLPGQALWRQRSTKLW